MGGLLLLVQLALGPSLEEVQVGNVRVHAAAEHLALGIALAERADQARSWYGLGRREPGPFRLILVPDVEGLQRLTRGRGPAWGAGLTLPDARTIILRLDAGDPESTLRHELAHLILASAVPGRVPLWFAEGYAVVAAGEWGRLEALRLNLAVVRGRVPTLRALDAALRDAPTTVRVAYALAGDAVMSLARRHPTGSLEPLLGALERRTPFDEALRTSTGLTLDRFDEAWRKDVRHRYGVIVWLSAGGLWGVVVLWLVLARSMRRRADARRRAALDQGWEIPDEDAPGPTPSGVSVPTPRA